MTDRPTLKEEEIEITPEMIEAGAEALSAFDEYEERYEAGCEKIFRAMMSVSPGRLVLK